MQSGIYKIVNIINGKLYVGSGVNFERRWRKHRSLLNKNKHHSSYLQNAWNKDGESNFNFEIIEECEPLKEVLETREQYYIDTLKPEYNMCPRAYSCVGIKRSEQTKQKMSGENNPNFGKTGEKNPMFGKHHSEEAKEKIGDASRGENNPMFGKTGENHPGVKLSWDLVHEIRRRYKEEKISQRKLAFEYGVSRGCVQCIVENRTWKESLDVSPSTVLFSS